MSTHHFAHLFFYSLLLLSIGCQNKFRKPDQIKVHSLSSLIYTDQSLVSNSKHASYMAHYDGSSRPVLLIIHGLHESPYYMKHWVDFFSKYNYQIISMRIPGHFEKNEDALKTVTAEQWINQAEQFFNAIIQKHPQVSILGYSTGGTIASYLALQSPQNVSKLYLISPALSLSNSVFLSSLILGQTPVSVQKSCQNPNAILCQMIKNLDSQASQMLQDNLELSPQAGRQVQRLIDFTFSIRSKKSDYYENILNMLMTIKTPTYIADSELDNVVNTWTNKEWMKRRQNTEHYLNFRKNDNILHTQMARGPSTPFSTGVIRYNPKIQQIENLFLKGILK